MFDNISVNYQVFKVHLNYFSKNIQKKFVICLVRIEKCSTFASAFQKECDLKEEFFERFRYKQASSTGL